MAQDSRGVLYALDRHPARVIAVDPRSAPGTPPLPMGTV